MVYTKVKPFRFKYALLFWWLNLLRNTRFHFFYFSVCLREKRVSTQTSWHFAHFDMIRIGRTCQISFLFCWKARKTIMVGTVC